MKPAAVFINCGEASAAQLAAVRNAALKYLLGGKKRGPAYFLCGDISGVLTCEGRGTYLDFAGMIFSAKMTGLSGPPPKFLVMPGAEQGVDPQSARTLMHRCTWTPEGIFGPKSTDDVPMGMKDVELMLMN
jgi:hypothetical protein